MAASPQPQIKLAGQFIIKELLEHGAVSYSKFYDGTTECNEKLKKDIGVTDEWHQPEPLVDLAVFQLKEQGIVETKEMDSELIDGTNDYSIAFSKKGKQLIQDGFSPTYYSCE